ncbi:MAG: hypothetical protein ACRDWT_08135 [Jatrophihabitantaceae bacterium]
MSDPRATVEYRVPAISLKKGDLVNTSPGEDDWQEVVSVHTNTGQLKAGDLRTLVESLGGRYVVVELTDLAPVDSGVFFIDGVATVDDDGGDQPLSEVVSGEDGVRTYLYTRYELVTVRAAAG